MQRTSLSGTPLVSVIVPVFNCETFVGAAIQSILDQTYPHIEIIVVDDGSTDATAERLAAFGSAIAVIHQENRGQSAARNLGISRAKGEIIGLLDADDLWPRDHVELLAPAILTEQCDLARGKTITVRNVGTDAEERTSAQFNPSLVGACLYRRAIFDLVGPFDEGMRAGEDADWNARAAQLGCREERVGETTLLYRRHEGNMTNEQESVRGGLVHAVLKNFERSRSARREASTAPELPREAPRIGQLPAQSPSAVLMVRPRAFAPNPETAVDNSFQESAAAAAARAASERAEIAAAAVHEVDAIAAALRAEGVEVIIVDDLAGSDVPDSVFPNNWISTHSNGRVVLYPMATPSRRRERRSDIVELLRARFEVRDVLDLSSLERDGVYLEGTGALVLDHMNRVAYMARSGRAHETALARWCDAFGYTSIIFSTVDAAGAPIYHTNVVLSIAERFAVVGLESIPDPAERAAVEASLAASGRELVRIDRDQVAAFAGNGLELAARGGSIFALSARARAALRPEQVATIERFARILSVNLPAIERSGGSLRCTLAGIHLTPIITST